MSEHKQLGESTAGVVAAMLDVTPGPVRWESRPARSSTADPKWVTIDGLIDSNSLDGRGSRVGECSSIALHLLPAGGKVDHQYYSLVITQSTARHCIARHGSGLCLVCTNNLSSRRSPYTLLCVIWFPSHVCRLLTFLSTILHDILHSVVVVEVVVVERI